MDLDLRFWRTSAGFEVDIIVGDMELAVECKAAAEPRVADLKGLRALKDEHQPKRCLLVTRGRDRRKTDDGIEILPWSDFCAELWGGVYF